MHLGANKNWVSMVMRLSCYARDTLLRLVFFSTAVLASVISVPVEHTLLSRQDLFNNYDISTIPVDYSVQPDWFLASSSQDDPLNELAYDECTFTLEGCPSIMEDPNSVAFEFGSANGMETGICDEGFGDDCTWFLGEGPTTFNIEDLGLPVHYHEGYSALGTDSRLDLSPLNYDEDYLASGFPDWTDLEAVAVNDPKPTIYYDCAKDYTSCIVYDRRIPDFKRKLSVVCPPDVSFGRNAMASKGSIPGVGLFGLPSAQCLLCLENGQECAALTCDVALFPSANNNWGQEWGSCKDHSCSCSNAFEPLGNLGIA